MVERIRESVLLKIKWVLDLVVEKGLLVWLIVFFLWEVSFNFNKWEFCDVIKVCCDWLVDDIFFVCVCGGNFYGRLGYNL